MANIMKMLGSSARMEPSRKTIVSIIVKPFIFIILMVIISVVTNMMPFYSDGTRMNLLDGSSALLSKDAKTTAPYDIPESGPALTDYTNNREPIARNALSSIGYAISDIFKVDIYTGIVLFICMLGMLYSLVIEINKLPFSMAERKFYKNAFNPDIDNNKFEKSFGTISGPAYLSAILVSTVVSLSFPTILFNFGKDKAGIIIHPILLVFIIILMVKALREGSRAKNFHKTLVRRRCENCCNIDCFRIAGKEYVRTDTRTKEHYNLNSDGSRGRTTRTEHSEHEVYKYTVICESCGDESSMTF